MLNTSWRRWINAQRVQPLDEEIRQGRRKRRA